MANQCTYIKQFQYALMYYKYTNIKYNNFGQSQYLVIW